MSVGGGRGEREDDPLKETKEKRGTASNLPKTNKGKGGTTPPPPREIGSRAEKTPDKPQPMVSFALEEI